MHAGLIGISLAMFAMLPARADVSMGITMPDVLIGITLPVYPKLQRIPGYPVYFAPQTPANYFFYDGLYWVYEDENWFSSNWYNGPWHSIDAGLLPLTLLRVPVRYYRKPPNYFQGWKLNEAPRWHERSNEHWNQGLLQGQSARPDPRTDHAGRPAPLPNYQRHYQGTRYPDAERQQELHGKNYGYQSDYVTRERLHEKALGLKPDGGTAIPHGLPNDRRVKDDREGSGEKDSSNRDKSGIRPK